MVYHLDLVCCTNHISINVTKDRLFAQPINFMNYKEEKGVENSSTLSPSSFPDFVQSNLSLYRFLENSVAKFLDGRYSQMNSFAQRKFVRPLKDAKFRASIIRQRIDKIRHSTNKTFEKSLLEQFMERMSNLLIVTATTATTTSSSKKKASSDTTFHTHSRTARTSKKHGSCAILVDNKTDCSMESKQLDDIGNIENAGGKEWGKEERIISPVTFLY